MTRRAVASALALTCWVPLGSCNGDKAGEAPVRGSPSAAVDSPKASQESTSVARDTIPLGVHRPDELVEAARTIIAVLRGEAGFDRIRVADTVTLYLAPEAGGAPRTVTRAMLRNPSSWTIRGPSPRSGRQGIRYSFVPSKGTPEVTMRVGRHMKCREYPLSSIYKQLAGFPHVGIRLAYGTDSCLQSQNFTLVFDPNQKPPTLIAAVYDQWEW